MAGYVIGDWRVDRIEELRIAPRPPGAMFPAWRDAMLEGRDWLFPDHIDPTTGHYVASIGGWLLRGQGRVILLDTGVGRGKARPAHPRYHLLESRFLDGLARLGVAPGQVDTVVLSHCHVDHVGGCTLSGADGWQPAFHAARHVMPRDELDDARAKSIAPGRTDDASLIFADSIAPLEAAGLLDAVAWPAAIAPGLTLEAAPGHTIGHAMVRLVSAGTEALFTFDIAHSVLQLIEPDWNTPFCEHQALARHTRHRVLGEAAGREVLLFPTHFGHAGPCLLRADGAGFRPRFLPALSEAVP